MDDKPPEHQSLARTLIDKGLLSQSQVTGILEYQCRLPPGQYMSFTEVVLEFEYLTEEVLVQVMGESYYASKDPISHILLEQGLVSAEQLKQALAVLDTFSREHVAEVLVDMGFATRQDIERAISKHQIQQSESLRTLRGQDNQDLKHRLASAFSHLSPANNTPPDIVSSNTEPAQRDDAVSDPLSSEVGRALTGGLANQKKQETQRGVHLPLGRKLIAGGFLTESELQDALDYQERLPHVMHKPLGEILVQMGYISEVLLEELLEKEEPAPVADTPAQPPRIGDLLIQAGIIQEWQLAHALRLQFTPAHASQRLGEILVNMGYTTREKIERVLQGHYAKPPAQPAESTPPAPALEAVPSASPPPEQAAAAPRPLGQLLIEREYISKAQLESALQMQQELGHEYTPLGDILVMKGFLTESQLQEVLSEQGRFQRKPLGQVLVDMGLLEEWQLSYALCVQHSAPPDKRILLGDILLAMEYITEADLQSALKEQQN